MKRKPRLSVLLMALVLSFGCLSYGFFSIGANAVKVEVIIGFVDYLDIALIRQHGGEVQHNYTLINAVLATLPRAAVESLGRNSKIAYIQENSKVELLGQVTPWGVERVKAPEVWPQTKGNSIKIAILDTGISPHEDLQIYGGYDFVNSDDDPDDDNGHGTHVAGIVAAIDNTIGVVGAAPEVHLYAVKMLDSDGTGTVGWAVKGIEWAIDNGMHLVSMSWGSSTNHPALRNAVNSAYRQGLLLVAAAGNSGNPDGEGDNVEYPARYDAVIAVAATDRYNERASWSSTGPTVELAAPGVSIYSTWKDNNYATISGTSMACPHVSGVAALIRYKNSSLTNKEVRSILQNTATDLGDEGRDNLYGYGLVNASAAISAISSEVVTVNIVNPPDGSTVKDTVTVQASVENTTAPINKVEYTVDNSTFTGMAYNSTNGYWEAEWDTPREANISYTIIVRAEDVNGNTDQKTVTVTVDNPVEFTISGTVYDRNGTAVQNQYVTFKSESFNVGTYTDEQGSFSITVPADVYTIELSGSNHTSNTPQEYWLSKNTTLNISENTSITFTLQNRYLSGKIIDAEGNPVANVTIQVTSPDNNSSEVLTTFDDFSGWFKASTLSNDDGEFNISVFPNANVSLTIIPPEDSPYDSLLLTNIDINEDATIVITLPQTTDISASQKGFGAGGLHAFVLLY
ncbi:MAG: S8 family serine peptidase [Candidatus Bathyarchaeia archaeon]